MHDWSLRITFKDSETLNEICMVDGSDLDSGSLFHEVKSASESYLGTRATHSDGELRLARP